MSNGSICAPQERAASVKNENTHSVCVCVRIPYVYICSTVSCKILGMRLNLAEDLAVRARMRSAVLRLKSSLQLENLRWSC